MGTTARLDGYRSVEARWRGSGICGRFSASPFVPWSTEQPLEVTDPRQPGDVEE